MGSPLTEERGIYAALNNCAFVSTSDIAKDPSKPFCFLMDASMCGVGVGFDTVGAGSLVVPGPNRSVRPEHHIISDSREGWVEALRLVLDAYFLNTPLHTFDYSLIRPEGAPIKGFGGVAPGPKCLEKLLVSVSSCLDDSVGKPISVTTIVDICNMIGTCVVSGNVRRTAEIAFGEAADEFLDLKNYKKNPRRANFGWVSNNSIFAQLGMDYGPACQRVIENGEPGFAWLQNMQDYSRMHEPPVCLCFLLCVFMEPIPFCLSFVFFGLFFSLNVLVASLS